MKVRPTEHLLLFLKFLSTSTIRFLMYVPLRSAQLIIVNIVCCVINSNVGEPSCRYMRTILLTEMLGR
jgi:hypothetical protein